MRRRLALSLLVVLFVLSLAGCSDKNEETVPGEAVQSAKYPLALMSAEVSLNDGGKPEVRVIVKNISRKTIDAYTVGIYCFDRFGNQVKRNGFGSNRYAGINQSTVRPGETFGSDYFWTLHGQDNTAKIEVVLEKVHFTDDTVWLPQEGQKIAIKGVLDQ